MAKYHINDNQEIKPCQARIKCKFGGDSGEENHFSTIREAEAFIEEESSKGTFNKTTRKRRRSPKEFKSSIELDDSAKKHVDKFIDKGYEVNSASEYEEIYIDGSSTMFDVTEIDLIDTPKYNNAMAALFSRHGHPFHGARLS